LQPSEPNQVEPTSDLLAASFPSVEVIPVVPSKPARRKFSASFKLKVLAETDRLAEGEVGAYLRKNGLYSTYLSAWRVQRERGALAELQVQARGRKKAEVSASTDRELAVARKELERVKDQLRQANLVLEIQKKVLSLCEERLPSKSRE
jgi:transposase-like protein